MIDASAESERARELRKYRILDTGPDVRFDRLVALTRDLFQAPFVLISLLDDGRQWFKSNIGFPASGGSSEDAFCAHAILGEDVLVICDTRSDPRFAHHSLVRNEPHIRFYAGAPLVVRSNVRLGTLCIMDVRPRPFSDQDAALLKELAAIAVNLLDLHRAESELKEEIQKRQLKDEEIRRRQLTHWKTERLLAQASHMTHIGSWEYIVDTGEVIWSEEVYRIHEVPQDFELTLEKALSFYPGDIRDRVRHSVDEAARQGTLFEFELPLVTAKGNQKWVRSVGEVQREGSKVVRIFGTFEDVTERNDAQKKIDFLTRHDTLTKLANRTVFRERLDKAAAVSAEQDSPFALLMLDLDRFKEVNDTLGHHAGDALIREIADRMAAVCGKDDLAARTGGDEFAIILSKAHLRDDVTEFAETLLQRVTQALSSEGRPLDISASIGIAMSPRDGTDSEVLLRNADIALHAAKSQGRKRFVFYDHGMRVELERRRYTLTSIRNAIDREELVPFYQPIFSLRDGSLVAFEALVRWVKARGLIAAPGAFAAALHDPVLSDLIGTYMIQKVVNQIATWDHKGLRGFRVAVNVAAGQLRGGRLAATVLEELQSYSVEPKRLAIEITETALLSYHSDEVADILRELHDQGVRIALDDFGTGYASLSHLRDFPVDTVKIDKSFVQNMLTSEQSASIVEAIISLAHKLKKSVTAEGIESLEVAARLRKLGCDSAQGYIFGRPMPADQAQALLTHPRFTGTGQPAAERIARIRSVS